LVEMRKVPLSVTGPDDRLEDVGEHHADHEIHLVALQRGADLGDRHVGPQLIVDHQRLGGPAAELVVEVAHAQHPAVPQLRAQRRLRPGQHRDESDAQGRRLRDGGRRQQARRHAQQGAARQDQRGRHREVSRVRCFKLQASITKPHACPASIAARRVSG
jgi:hypothetical protein